MNSKASSVRLYFNPPFSLNSIKMRPVRLEPIHLSSSSRLPIPERYQTVTSLHNPFVPYQRYLFGWIFVIFWKELLEGQIVLLCKLPRISVSTPCSTRNNPSGEINRKRE